jgi:D-aminopeptidase
VPPPPSRPRDRAQGLSFGELPVGTHNTITDVSGVRVGHVTRWSDGPAGVARTGVTASSRTTCGPSTSGRMAAGPAVLNRCGEFAGAIAMAEWGTLEAPILLTSTTAIGRVFDAVVDAVFEAVPPEVDDEVIPVPIVGECDDSWLDEARRRPVTVADGRATSDPAPRRSGRGFRRASTGMITMGHRPGIGTSSRVLDGLGALGVLVLANFGGGEQLRIGGAPVGARRGGRLPVDVDPVLPHVVGDRPRRLTHPRSPLRSADQAWMIGRRRSAGPADRRCRSVGADPRRRTDREGRIIRGRSRWPLARGAVAL